MARRNHRGKEVKDGPLRGHFKTGRTYLPPVVAMKGYTPSDWARTDLPDLIWPLVLVATAGDRGAYLMSQAQQAVLAQIEPDEFPEGAGLDGRLTGLEAMKDNREQVLAVLREHSLAAELFGAEVLGVMRLYGPDMPGAWLFENIGHTTGPIPEGDALGVMANAIIEVPSDRHLNALVKAAPFGWLLQSGRLHFGPGMADELIGYPMVEENVGKADAFILSCYPTTKAMLTPEVEQARMSWARQFWNANWSMTECIPEELLAFEEDEEVPSRSAGKEESNESESPPHADAVRPPNEVSATVETAIDSVFDVYNGFLDAVIRPDAPVDLFSPARFEVLSGLVARAFRSAIAILRAPHQWSGEQAAPTMRSLVESRIVASWMIYQNDDAWFEKYQAYGRGKRKLHSSIVDDLVEQGGNSVPDEMAELGVHLKEKTGGDHGSMFQEVSVDSTFAGKSMRTMAEEADLSNDYRFLFQVQSGVTHGEWWALEDYALQRCLNPLHRFHYLPTLKPAYPPTPRFPEVLLAEFEQLVEIAVAGITHQETSDAGTYEEPPVREV